MSLVCSKQPDDHAVGDDRDTETRNLEHSALGDVGALVGRLPALMGAVEKSGRATQLSPVGMPTSLNLIFTFF